MMDIIKYLQEARLIYRGMEASGMEVLKGDQKNQRMESISKLMMPLLKKIMKARVTNFLATKADVVMLNKSALDVLSDKHLLIPDIGEWIFPSTYERRMPRSIDIGCQLHSAVYSGDIRVIKHMLEQRTPVNSVNLTNGETPLRIAVSRGNLKVVNFILKYCGIERTDVNWNEEIRVYYQGQETRKVGSNLKLYDSSETLLGYSGRDKKKITQYLLGKNCVDAREMTQTTPLMMAVKMGYQLLIEVLLAAGADIRKLERDDNKSALQMVFEESNFHPRIGILFFLVLCKNISTDEERVQALIDSSCQLHQACYFMNSGIVEFMIKRGFSVNSTEPVRKLSALHVAVMLKDVDTVRLLLEHGANVNAVNVNGSTPLASVYENVPEDDRKTLELLKILLSQEGVSLTTCDSNGFFQIKNTLLMGNRKAISLVLQSNLDYEANDQEKSNVFHYLAVNQNPGVINELKFSYVNKCCINTADEYGESPLHAAAKFGNFEMVNFLLDEGITPTCPLSEYGYTPLYVAYEGFRPEVSNKMQFHKYVHRLLQDGADPQSIYLDENDRELTIFDAAERTSSLNRMESVLAHLAILEGLGTPITEMTSTKINSHPRLKEYFCRCQSLIKEEISGTITLFKILTCNKSTFARYLGIKEFLRELVRLTCKPKFKKYLYYYNTLRTQVSMGLQYRKCLNGVTEVLCEISKDRFNTIPLVIDKIINYLDDISIQQLYNL